jgi:hypothetical protein
MFYLLYLFHHTVSCVRGTHTAPRSFATSVTLPSLPSLPLPEMPLGLGEQIDTDRY